MRINYTAIEAMQGMEAPDFRKEAALKKECWELANREAQAEIAAFTGDQTKWLEYILTQHLYNHHLRESRKEGQISICPNQLNMFSLRTYAEEEGRLF